MHRVVLINMPFASLQRPSISLTQIKSVIDRQLTGRVSTEIHYLNQEFANYLGMENYELVAETLEASAAGTGDWFFRQLAFPELPDNSYAYFRRYFSGQDANIEVLKHVLLEKRRGLERYFKRLIDKYKLDQAHLVGFTSMFSQNLACFGMARLLKERNPAIKVVMGGANCETPMGQEIAGNIAAVDFVFSGPALLSFPQFLTHLLDGEEEKCHALSGVFSKDNLSGARPPVGLLGEELPIDVEIPLDYDDFLATLKANFPQRRMEPCILFETSRGCWWGERSHCTFCGLNGGTMKYRSMEAERAIAQFNDLFDKYASTCPHFESVDNILPRSYLTDVLPRLSPPPHVKIFYEVKADLKDHEMRVLAEANVTLLQPGIESLASSTLKLMGKGTTSFINLRFLRSCIAYGIHPIWNILVGFPKEDAEVYRKYVADIPHLMHLPPPSGVFPVRFDRYSPYFVRANEYDLDLHPAEYFTYIYPFEEKVLRNMVYYFYDANPSAPYAVATAQWLGALRDLVGQWRDRWTGAEERPQLYCVGGDSVWDTRSGTAVTHAVGHLGVEVLACLEKPKKLAHVSSELAGVREADLEQVIAHLEELSLVFREGELLMSIVFPNTCSLEVAA